MYADILTLLKVILEMDSSDNSIDALLNFYIIKAKNSIMSKSVLTEDDYWAIDLTSQTAELAMYYYKSKKNIGLKSKTEGIKSFTYTNDDIPVSILATIPLPRITLQ